MSPNERFERIVSAIALGSRRAPRSHARSVSRPRVVILVRRKPASSSQGPQPGSHQSVPASSGGHCFLAGTLVVAERGVSSVESLRPGDRVLARDEHTGQQGYKEVVRTYRSWTDRVVHVRTARASAVQRGRGERHRVGEESGGSAEGGEEADEPPSTPGGVDGAGEQTLRCSPPHPFWVVGRGWVRAELLRVGDLLAGSSGEALVVVEHEVRAERAEVFNFHVSEWNTYFVAERDDGPFVWVHNKDGRTPPSRHLPGGEPPPGDVPASTPVGRRGQHLNVAERTNAPAAIGGRQFSGHALDRMQSQGIPPSAVDSAIQSARSVPGKRPGTTAHYDRANDLTVITDTASGRVVTVDYGKIRQ